jgi:hypothetical protein
VRVGAAHTLPRNHEGLRWEPFVTNRAAYPLLPTPEAEAEEAEAEEAEAATDT